MEIKTNKTYKSRSKLGCHENLRPLEYFLKKIYIVIPWMPEVFSLEERQLFLNGQTMFISNSQKEARYLSLSGLSLARFKITADILMTFAGELFTEEIEDTKSL